MLKNHKLFSIIINNYRDITVQTGQLFAHFWREKFGHMTGRPKFGLHKACISAHMVSKFQLYTSSGFDVKEINNFSSQKLLFFMFFLCANSQSRDLGSSKLVHKTLLLIFTLSPNFNFLGFYRLLAIRKINHLRKFTNKHKSTTRLREVPIKC